MKQVHASDNGYCLTNIDHMTNQQVYDYVILNTLARNCLMQGQVRINIIIHGNKIIAYFLCLVYIVHSNNSLNMRYRQSCPRGIQKCTLKKNV